MTYKLQGEAEVFDDARQLYLDPNALRAYGLKTTLSPRAGTLPEPYTLINRTAAEKLATKARVPAEALIGQTIITEPEYVGENRQVGFPFVVAGIFDDINLFSLHKRVEPYFITVSSRLRMDGRSIVQYDPATTQQTLAGIRTIYAGLKQQSPLEVEFLSENVANLYRKDRQIADLLRYFTIIAILLAAIGTVGITIFLTVARTKEIGIRKVLGASVWSIVRLATRDYVYLIGAALLLGTPIAVYVAMSWLSNFAYRIAIQPFALAMIGFVVMLVTSVLVGFIAYRAALINPVKSLRSE
jgi:putative ABC transport system permease protein